MMVLLGSGIAALAWYLFIADKSLYFTSRLLLQRRDVNEALLTLLAGLYANE
jgi:hypothetical protein